MSIVVDPPPSSKQSWATATVYIVAAVFFGVISVVSAGFDIATAEGAGAAVGSGPGFGLVVAGIRRLFGPIYLPKWIFWGALAGLAVNALPK